MWAITHVPTGTLVTNFNGSLFYSRKEAHRFLLQIKRLLQTLGTIYYIDEHCVIKSTPYLKPITPLFFMGAKPTGANNFTKFRFYCNQKRHNACEERTRRMLEHFGEKLKLIPENKILPFYNQIKQAHLYFTIHRVN
jgi:hypothetical protein